MRNQIKLQDINEHFNEDKKLISDEEQDKLLLINVRLFKCRLYNLGLKYLITSTCAITQSDIEKCYLRYATFNNVDFTGTNFINCDLENAIFNSCNLRYVTFRNCKLNLKEILGCLPSEINLKVSLLKELRMNQLSLGDNKTADELLIKIHDAEKDLLLERVKCNTSYHKKREDGISRIIAFFNYIMLQINDFVWGYGLKLKRLFRTGVLILLLFAVLIYFFTGEEYMVILETSHDNKVKLNFWESLYASYTNFTTIGYGHYIPTRLTSIILFSIQNLLGLVFLGFLISGVYRRIAK